MKYKALIIALFVVLLAVASSFVFHFYGGGRWGMFVPISLRRTGQ
jgi:hypothetical protein